MVTSKNIHARNTVWTEKVIYGISVYGYTYIHAIKINIKRDNELRWHEEAYMRGLGEQKEKRAII